MLFRCWGRSFTRTIFSSARQASAVHQMGATEHLVIDPPPQLRRVEKIVRVKLLPQHLNNIGDLFPRPQHDIVLRAREKVTDVIQVLGQKLHPDDFLHPAQLGRRIYYKMFGGTHLVNRAGLARTGENRPGEASAPAPE